MTSEREQLSLTTLERAIHRLEEALAQPLESPLALDGTIQRFEFVFELTWKTLRLVLANEGTQVNSPRMTIRAAYSAGLLSAEETWLALLEARNLSSHTYNDEIARTVYATIRTAFAEIQSAGTRIAERLSREAGE